MFDARSRVIAGRTLDPFAKWLADRSVSPISLTLGGLGFGVACGVSIVAGYWWLALALWLLNRLVDGLDGLVARRLGATDFGGFADIMADFVVYSGFVVAVAYRLPETRFVATVLLMTYYVSGAAFLAWSDLIARSGSIGEQTDNRSLNFLPGLAEGTETIVAYCLICIFPAWAQEIMWVFAGMVGLTALQRIWWARATLTAEPES